MSDQIRRGKTESLGDTFKGLIDSWPEDVRIAFAREALARLRSPAPAPEPKIFTLENSIPNARCQVCFDTGLLSAPLNAPVIDGVGVPVTPCTACGIFIESRRAKFERMSPIPAKYRRWTEASYLEFGLDKRALTLSQRMARARPQNVYFDGPIGTGKTYLSVMVFDAWATRMAGLWFCMPDLLELIRQGYDKEARTYRASDLTEMVATVPLLCLDDIGAEKLTDWVEEQIYRLVGRRDDEDRATIFTSNLALSALEEYLGERIASRIEGMCGGAVIPVRGANQRKRDRKVVPA